MLSQMIANHVSMLLSGDAKPIDMWEYAPQLFTEEKEKVEEERRKQELLLHRERMRAFAERFNQQRKGGSD